MGIFGDNKPNKWKKGKKLGKNQGRKENRKKWGKGQRGNESEKAKK